MADTEVFENDGITVVVATVNGQVNFDFDFLAYQAASVRVRVRNGGDLELGAGYSVSGLEQEAGGAVSLIGQAIMAGDRVTIYRSTPIRRLFDYQTAGDFRAETVNRELDEAIMIDQELRRDITRAYTVPIGETAGAIVPGEDGRLAIWDGGNLIPGPNAGNVEDAESFAIAAGAFAGAAAGSAGAASVSAGAAASSASAAATFAGAGASSATAAAGSATAAAGSATAAAGSAASVNNRFVATTAALGALPITLQSAYLEADGLEGWFDLRNAALPVAATDNFYASNTAGYHWERREKKGFNRSLFVASFFRSDADTTMDFYMSMDGYDFEKINNTPSLVVDGNPLIGRDTGLFFFRGWWYIPITNYGYNSPTDSWDIVINRSRDLFVWERFKVRLSGTNSSLYWEGGSAVGGSVPSNFIWAPKLCSVGDKIYVVYSVRYGADFVDAYGVTVKHFRPFYSECTDIETLAFAAPQTFSGIGFDGLGGKIDGQIYQHGGKFHLYLKNEYNKGIERWTANSFAGPWNSGYQAINFGVPVEAPCLVSVKRQAGSEFLRLYADGYYSGLYYFKDSFDGGATWGGDQTILSDYAMRHGNVLNVADLDNPSLAEKMVADFSLRSRAAPRRAPPREVNLGSGAVNLEPNDDVLYFITGSNVVTLNITSRSARRFFLAAKTGTGTAGINVSANARFPTARAVGFGATNDRIIEVILTPGTGGQYLIKG